MTWMLLYLLTAFVIGRVQELFKFLMPLRIVLIVGVACAISTVLTPAGKRQPLLRKRGVRNVLGVGGLAAVLLPFGVWPGGSLPFLLGNYSKVGVFFLLIVPLTANSPVLAKRIWR